MTDDQPPSPTRPRIAMLLNPNNSFERVWADAAATHSDVVRITITKHRDGGEPTALPYLWRVVDQPGAYLLDRSRSRRGGYPMRLLARRQLIDQLTRSIELLQRDGGAFDLLHWHFTSSSRAMTEVARRVSLPYVVTEHSTAFSGQNPDNQLSRRGLAQSRRCCAGAAAVLPVSKQLETAMVSYDLDANYFVLPNPVDTIHYFPPDELPPPAPIELVSVARLVEVKGHDVLLDAVARLRGPFPGLRLTLVGAGGRRASIEARAHELGLDDHVRFTGFLGAVDIAPRLRAAHAFVLASRWENLSVAALEACVTGLPAVVTNVGGLAEIDAEGITFVEPGDVDGLTAALHAMLADLPDLATRRRRAELARSRYAPDAIGAQLTDIYRQLLDRS